MNPPLVTPAGHPLSSHPQVNDAPTVTAEIFAIPLENDRYIVYAPLRRVAFIANTRLINLLASLQQGPPFSIPSDLDQPLLEFLRRLKIVDANPEHAPITTFVGTPLPTSVTLFLTTACNLRCTYCYAAAGDTPLKSMSLPIAKRGIDFVSDNAVRQQLPGFQVAYHGGGEPTSNWRVMTDSHAYARGRASGLGLRLDASSATNGVLRDDQIDWIVANLDGASVSFDGLPEVHDRNRLTVAGTASSGRVIHTLRRFDAAGFGYGIRVTVTHDQIARLPRSIEYICAHFRPARIQVEPAYQLGRWAAAPSAETQEFIEAYRRAQECASHYGREICYSAARLDVLTNHFCGVTQDAFALSPDGNVSACYESFSEDSALADVFFYGSPDSTSSGYKFKLPVLNNLRKQAVQHRKFCEGCFAKWHCAGDCYNKAVTLNGRGEFTGTDRCHITRELTKDQIVERIAASGGVVWCGDEDVSQTEAR